MNGRRDEPGRDSFRGGGIIGPTSLPLDGGALPCPFPFGGIIGFCPYGPGSANPLYISGGPLLPPLPLNLPLEPLLALL